MITQLFVFSSIAFAGQLTPMPMNHCTKVMEVGSVTMENVISYNRTLAGKANAAEAAKTAYVAACAAWQSRPQDTAAINALTAARDSLTTKTAEANKTKADLQRSVNKAKGPVKELGLKMCRDELAGIESVYLPDATRRIPSSQDLNCRAQGATR